MVQLLTSSIGGVPVAWDISANYLDVSNNLSINGGLILPSINSGSAVISSGKLICNLSSLTQGGFFVNMSDNITDISFNNPKSGGVYYFYLQGGSSTRRVCIISTTKIMGGIGNVFISAGSGTRGVLTAAYDGTMFVINCTSYDPPTRRIIAYSGNISLYSIDGVTWNKLTNAYYNAPSSTTTPVSISSRGYYDASFGYLWSCRNNPTANPAGSNFIIFSPDGLNWSGIGITQVFSTACQCIAYSPSLSRFVAGGSGTNTLAYSNDGFNWIGLGFNIFSSIVSDIAWSGTIGKFVAVGTGTANNTAYSSDGITWTGTAFAAFGSGGSGFSVVSTGSRFIAVGSNTNTLAYSNDGVNWTGLGLSPFSSAGTWLAYSPTLSRVVAVGSGTNTIAYSDDNGSNWTGLGLTYPACPFTSSGLYVAWVGDKFLANGSGTNTNAYSSTGASNTWTALSITTTTAPNANLINILWNGI
jgi:hypothetical protein